MNIQVPHSLMVGLPLPFSFREVSEDVPDLIEIYENIDLYRDRYNNLRIHKIQISSPGFFSFDGLGDIVREIREMIKDIAWRNRQEKTIGQLEIISKYLKMGKKYPDVHIPVPRYLKNEKYLVDAVNGNINNLKRLEDKGLLLPIAENIDKFE